MVKTLINNIGVPESLYSETEKLLQKVKTGEITFIQCSGAVANRINNWMNDENCANLSQSLQDNNNDALLKTWVSIDYYISTLKRDFSKNLRKIRNELTEKIVLLGLDKADNQELSDIITLEKELNETAKDKEKVKTAEFAAKRKELAAHLISRKSLFVLFDEDFNSGFPYVSIDGRIEIFLRYETGVCLKKHYEKTNYGHTTLRRLEKKEYEKLFRAMIHMGIHLARLDNGIFPVDLLVSELAAGEGSCNVVERFNSAMRGLFIRNLQLKSRIQKASQQIKGTLQEKAMLEAMLTCRFNGYREFGNSIVYVFSNPPFEKGVTLYTKKALEKAKKLCKAAKLDEKALVARLLSLYAKQKPFSRYMTKIYNFL